ncbi:MAG: cache domain-containing protein [Desulfobulbus sp.]|nr:cache domain-containing protein [Desulfobulbus sp.]
MKKVRVAIGLVALLLTGVSGGICGVPGASTDRALLRAVVHSAALGLGAVAVNKDGACNTGMIRQYVNAVRFLKDQTGYFFVYDYTNNFNVAHATLKDFPGHDKTKYQDSRGMYVIQELSKIAKSKTGCGFLVYYWINPDTKNEEKKLGYVEVIPGTTLYIGSGVYMH